MMRQRRLRLFVISSDFRTVFQAELFFIYHVTFVMGFLPLLSQGRAPTTWLHITDTQLSRGQALIHHRD